MPAVISGRLTDIPGDRELGYDISKSTARTVPDNPTNPIIPVSASATAR